MAEPQPKTDPPIDKAADNAELKNIKAEFDRKIGNIEKSNQALMAQLQAIAKTGAEEKTPPKKKAEIKDIWYDDPEGAADAVVEKATSKILNTLQAQQVDQQKKGSVIQQLYREYPELQDFDNPLSLKAVEFFDKLSEDEKAHPMAYRLAVKEAAEELDLKPKNKRKKTEDDDTAFSLSDSGVEKPARQSKKAGQLDQRTLDFAKLVGLDVEDEKVLESLKVKSQRTNWNRWE